MINRQTSSPIIELPNTALEPYKDVLSKRHDLNIDTDFQTNRKYIINGGCTINFLMVDPRRLFCTEEYIYNSLSNINIFFVLLGYKHIGR